MPTVDAFTIAGLDLAFLSNDHWPPHFHATSPGAWEVRVYILSTTADDLDFDTKWPPRGAGPNGRTQRTLRRLVVEHRSSLLDEFDRKVNFIPPSS